MRPSPLTVVALLAAAAACLAQAGAEPTTPRRSITTPGLSPTGPSSDDLDWCWESLLTLGHCKHDLLASFLAGRPVPRECCVAVDEADHHCGPLTRAFLGSILPRGLLAQCAHQLASGGAPATRPSQRRAPPRAPALETGPRTSGGAHPPPPPVPEAPAGGSSGTHRSPSVGGSPPAAGAAPPPQKGVPAVRSDVKGSPVE